MLISLVVAVLLLAASGAQVGTATLLLVVCVAVVAYAALRLGKRSKN